MTHREWGLPSVPALCRITTSDVAASKLPSPIIGQVQRWEYSRLGVNQHLQSHQSITQAQQQFLASHTVLVKQRHRHRRGPIRHCMEGTHTQPGAEQVAADFQMASLYAAKQQLRSLMKQKLKTVTHDSIVSQSRPIYHEEPAKQTDAFQVPLCSTR